MEAPSKKSSLLLRTNLSGSVCSRALINLKHVLNTFKTENIKQNKNKDSILSIFSLFSFVKNFVSQSLE